MAEHTDSWKGKIEWLESAASSIKRSVTSSIKTDPTDGELRICDWEKVLKLHIVPRHAVGFDRHHYLKNAKTFSCEMETSGNLDSLKKIMNFRFLLPPPVDFTSQTKKEDGNNNAELENARAVSSSGVELQKGKNRVSLNKNATNIVEVISLLDDTITNVVSGELEKAQAERNLAGPSSGVERQKDENHVKVVDPLLASAGIITAPDGLRRRRIFKTELSLSNGSNEIPDAGMDVGVPVAQKAYESDEVAGPSQGTRRVIDEKLVYKIIELFPDACPEYVRDICDMRVNSEFMVESIVNIMLETDYPKRKNNLSPVKKLDPEEQFENLKEIFPDADPNYLQMKCHEFDRDEAGLKEFIAHALERHDYPTLKDYLRKQQLSAQQKQYTTEFNVEDFVQLFPDPEATFNDPKRTFKWNFETRSYVVIYMRNKYKMLPVRYIDSKCYSRYCTTITGIITSLDKMMEDPKQPRLKLPRKLRALPNNIQDIPTLQELAYDTHREEILAYIREKKEKELREKEEAIASGNVETCGCCYDDEVMPRDNFTCEKGCKFCRECIKKSVEVAMGEGKTIIMCLGSCDAEFGLHALQQVLPPKIFSKLAQKKAVAEVKAAGIEDLENCPFCDFATIPDLESKLFRCLNPECMKESCKKCKQPSHVPLKCEELEVDEEVKIRTYIENQMTEALLRKCWKCGFKFYKEEGCNKMTCPCGAKMCYLCRQPVADYKHFNGIGGDRTDLCPLYSDNIAVNELMVMKAAEAAKSEVDVAKLKHDPSADLQKHFEERKKVVNQPYLHALHANNQAHLPVGHANNQVNLRAVQANNHQAHLPVVHANNQAHLLVGHANNQVYLHAVQANNQAHLAVGHANNQVYLHAVQPNYQAHLPVGHANNQVNLRAVQANNHQAHLPVVHANNQAHLPVLHANNQVYLHAVQANNQAHLPVVHANNQAHLPVLQQNNIR